MGLFDFLGGAFASHNESRAGKHTAIPQEYLGPQLGTFQQANLGAPVSTFGQANVGQSAGLDLSNYGHMIGSAQGQAQGYGGPADDTIRRQGSLADQLQASANGQGPSPAEEMLRRATSANANAAAGAAASARGINPALAARMGVDAAASANQHAAGQAAELRAKERIGAREQMAGVLQGRAGNQLGQQGVGVQALGTAGGLQNAQNANQISNTFGAQDLRLRDALGTNSLNLQGSLGQQGLNLQNTLGTGALNLQGSLGQQGLNLKNWGDAENRNVQADAINAGIGAGNAQANNSAGGGLLGGIGAAFGLSDERAKTDVHRSISREAIPGVPQATYRYKGEPEGVRHRGVIAQDLEKVRPDLVATAADGMRVVPARPPFMYASGGQVNTSGPSSPLWRGMLGDNGGGSVPYGGPLAAPDEGDTGIVDAPYTGAMARPTGKDGQSPIHDYLNVLHGVNDPGMPSASAAAGKSAGQMAGSGLQAFGQTMQSGSGSGSGDEIGHFMSLSHSGMYASGGRVPSLVSPAESVIPERLSHNPDAAAEYVASGKGKVPGRAKVKGDNPANDTVKRQLEVGSIVIPRSITQGDNVEERASSFIRSVMRRSSSRGLHSGGYLAEKAGPGPASRAHKQNLADGGVVEADPVRGSSRTVGTARGLGRDETRRRIKAAPRPSAAGNT